MDKKEKKFLTVLNDHKGIIYKVANTYCNDPTDQDDLVQEIVLQLWSTIENFNNTNKWSTWVYRVALNTSISFYRRHRTRKEKTVPLSPMIEVLNTSEQGGADDDFLLLTNCLRALKEIDRALFLLHLEGLSTKDIADIINISPTNVTTKISRIKKKLKIQFHHHKNKKNGPN